jgi:ABC-type lipoprotein release transport system permease subunit
MNGFLYGNCLSKYWNERKRTMSLYLRLAWRNIWRHRRRTMIVVLAIGLTLWLMMFYDGFVAGFNDAIYANAIKVLGGNIQIHANGYKAKADKAPLLPLENEQVLIDAALAQPQVLAASRRINTGGLVSNHEGSFTVAIVGLEPEKELPVSLPAQHVSSGKYLSNTDQDVLYIGKGLADEMSVKVGDRITLVGRGTHEQMRSRTMTVGGIFDVGMADIEKRTVYMSLLEAQNLYGLAGKSTEIAISLAKLGQEHAVMSAISPVAENYEMDSWENNFPELNAALEKKGGVMNVFSVVILLIAGIGILNLLLMAVYERTREIGVLGALGWKPRQISTLFILEGLMMGVVGIIFGVVLGLVINGLLGQVGFDFSKFSTITEYTALISGRVYPTLGMDKLIQRVITVIVICALASLYPAREASQNEPAVSLHFV